MRKIEEPEIHLIMGINCLYIGCILLYAVLTKTWGRDEVMEIVLFILGSFILVVGLSECVKSLGEDAETE